MAIRPGQGRGISGMIRAYRFAAATPARPAAITPTYTKQPSHASNMRGDLQEETMTSPHEQREAQGDSRPEATPQALAALRRHLRQTPEVFRRNGRQAAEALRRNTRWAVLSAAIVVASLVAVYLTGALESGGTRPSAGSPVTTTSPTAAAVPTATSASQGLSEKEVASLTKWNAHRGGVMLTVMSSQLGNATQAAGLKLFAQMRQACSKLATAVAAAKAGPSIPDPVLQRQYTEALSTLAKATAYCERGISARPYGDEDIKTHENVAMVNKSLAAFAAGAKKLYRATAQIKALSLSHSHGR